MARLVQCKESGGRGSAGGRVNCTQCTRYWRKGWDSVRSGRVMTVEYEVGLREGIFSATFPQSSTWIKIMILDQDNDIRYNR